MTLTFLFVYCFLLFLSPRFCCNYANFSTGHFIAELTLYQSLVKIPRFTDQTTVAMSHNKQLIDRVRKGV